METNFDISKLTSFKVGGKIKKVYFPTSVEEFVEVLQTEPEAKIFGNLSNTLVSSDGYNGVLIITTKMSNIQIDGTKVIADCGVKGPKLAQTVCEKGLSGFEFMIGFPGSIGGNICMNASAHSQCISDKLVSVKVFDGTSIKNFSKDEMKFSYRHSICMDKNLIILSAEFELEPSSSEQIQEKMKENLAFRTSHQPSMALPNCGSVFKNPEGNSAGKLLDSIGAKGMSVGGARVWENHANFIINDKTATSLDILKLMHKMSNTVKEKYGIKLTPEVRFLGGNNKEEEELWSKIK
ncbi:UDP-N-acetylmuramate dehydrogenase [bacterium]|nr:UDP-N-acetylmuramate dehydrogenase [bacterium]